MSSAPTYGSQQYAYAGSNANNRQAQLGNAYQELAKELSSEKLKVIGGYTLGRVIGEGTYGSVHLATHRSTGTRCAVKKIPKAFSPHLTREIHHHRRLHHPGIVHLHEILVTETHIWLVTELCSGGEMYDYLVERGRILEGEARKLFGELTVAVGFMHRQGVVHRDLKLENVLLDGELRVKLGDLGFAREWQKGRLMETFCGTTGYASPEMLSGRKYLGVETDIWSLGIILYTLLSGGLPFDDDNEGVMKELILKGEYEEPEWLSDDARDLVKCMLRPEPSQRISIEGILTHPWFKRTIVDQMPEQGGEATQPPSAVNSPNPGGPHFEEPFVEHSHPPPRHLSVPSPLHENPPAIPPAISEESDQSHSENSLDMVDSEHGKADTGVTTPTTAEDDDIGGKEPIKRVHSGEFSQTERDLEMLHSNTSQSTIRKVGSETPTQSAVKNRVAVKTALEGQTEVDEDALGEEESAILHPDDHSLHLPVAQHSRTPSRTKRRSVSSTLSLERKHSHHSTSGSFTSWPPEDFLVRLNETRLEPFTTPSEKHLLSQLSDIGFNTGQIVHSVTSDACDSSAAAWWMLRAKQAERGENDEVILARQQASQRRNERAAAYAREERKRQQREREQGREPLSSTDSGKNANVKFLDQTPSVSILEHPTTTPSEPTASIPLSVSPEQMTPGDVVSKVPQPALLHAHSTSQDRPPPRSPIEETRSFATPPHAQRVESSPGTAESSPARDRERPNKTRSPSMSMLQRATSVLVPGAWKNEDKDKEKQHEKDNQKDKLDRAAAVDEGDKKDKDDKRANSPTKLTKAPPKSKMVKSESDNSISRSLDSHHHNAQPEAGPSSQPLATARTSSTLASEATSSNTSPSKTRNAKRDAFWSWNSFRYMFNDPRRRRSRDETGFPIANKDVKAGPAVVLSRGISGRGPHVNRVVLPMRRSSIDGRPIYSRRSSSVNSRRSSFNSAIPHESSHDALPALGRRTSGRSHGSQTPTSEREYNPLSRPSSLHERDLGHLPPSARRSSQSLRSPSMQSDHSGRGMRYSTPASPLHNYQRRAPKGTDSRRVRHIRVIPEGHIVRSESVASSIRSGASSRASSRERVGGRDDSDYDTGREDASIRSKRKSDVASLAQQIHRRNSPLTLPPGFSGHRRHSLKPAPPKLPLRDVFQNKEDEWVSDDDDIYSGGLGQKGQQKHIEGKSTWEPNTRAAFPSHNRDTLAPAKKHGRKYDRRGSSSSRSRKNSSDEEEVNKSAAGLPIGGRPEERSTKVDGEMHAGSQGRRRGIPSGRGTAPVIEEEEEEEE